MADASLQILIDAQDQASAKLTALADKIDALGTSTKTTAAASEEAGISVADMAAGFGIATTAVAALEEAEKLLVETVKEAIALAQQGQERTAVFSNELNNEGKSVKELLPQIEALAKTHESLGFTSEDSMASLEKLTTVTKTFADAQQLSGLAMDLARSKQIDLGSATEQVVQILQGRGRSALDGYGESTKTLTTVTEQLDFLMGRIGGDAKAAGASGAEAGDILKAHWQDVEKELGAAFLPALEKIITEISKIATDKEFIAWVTQVAGKIADFSDQVIRAIDAGEKFYQNNKTIIDGLGEMNKIINNILNPLKELTSIYDYVTGAFQKAKPAAEALNMSLATGADMMSKVTDQVVSSGSALSNYDIPSAAAAKAVDKLSTAMDDFSTKMQQDQVDNAAAVATFADTATNDYQAYQDKIANINSKVLDDQQSYKDKLEAINTGGDTSATTAYEAEQKKLTDLQKKQLELTLKTSNGTGPGGDKNQGADFLELSTVNQQVTDTQNELARHAKDKLSTGTTLSDAAKTDTGKDAIQKDEDKTAAAVAKADSDNKKAIKKTQDALDAENDAYDASKKKLVDAIISKYDAMEKSINSEYDKIKKTVGKNVDDLNKIEAERKTAQASLSGSTQTSITNALAPASAQSNQSSASQATAIHVMENATIHAMTPADIDALVNKVMVALASTMQNQRMGLATHH
jgi:hypothetical protein